ncbi:hypothetical protein [Novosphingobium sp. JCM 18896]|uniref:hypothetical protein n=1 Tax=Novosphingobium sp. JCM 18896 TaxID=2989731 RepID=UPI0022218CCD|nr:hypothetical protein [Novosphingobium sp. JCM 18896]MCW1430678.1 hypothetical protein [Novosphingobium sp. JCM 18896]
MNAGLVDWIWTVRGSVELAPGQTHEEAFDRLDPLFHTGGTSHQRTGDTLTFSKKAQAAQDKMSIFDGGVLRIEQGATGGVLRYRLTSRALLFCFLAPLLFLTFAGLTIAVGKLDKPAAEAAEKKKPEKKEVVRELNPVDKFLGAPAPEKPKKDDKKDEDEGPSPVPAYVFAGLFAVLYVVGRILEDRLIRRLFRKRLSDDLPDDRQAAV